MLDSPHGKSISKELELGQDEAKRVLDSRHSIEDWCTQNGEEVS